MAKKPTEEEILAQQMIAQEEAQEYEDVDSDMIDRVKEITRAELFKYIIGPDYGKSNNMKIGTTNPATGRKSEDGGIQPFTKELKTSILDTKDIEIAKEASDLARSIDEIGAGNFAKKLLAFRDTFLALAASKNGALMRLANTEWNVKSIRTEKKGRSFFRRGGGEEAWTS